MTTYTNIILVVGNGHWYLLVTKKRLILKIILTVERKTNYWPALVNKTLGTIIATAAITTIVAIIAPLANMGKFAHVPLLKKKFF
jgi:hypothetical protein